MKKLLLIGIALGFALKLLDMNIPRSVTIPGRFKLAFPIGKIGIGYNDLGYAVIFIALWLFVSPIGLGGLIGLGFAKTVEAYAPGTLPTNY